MFNIKAPETFPATLKLTGQGREQVLKLVFRHKDRAGYVEMCDDIAKGRKEGAVAILEFVDSWEADMPLTRETLEYLEKQQPGAQWAIVTGYGQALTVARSGN